MGSSPNASPKSELKKICKRPVSGSLASSIEDARKILEVDVPSVWAARHCERHHRKGCRVIVHIKTAIVYGPWADTEMEAEQHTALEVCILLHAQGQLDRNLNGIGGGTQPGRASEIIHIEDGHATDIKSRETGLHGTMAASSSECSAEKPDGDVSTSSIELKTRQTPQCFHMPEGPLHDSLHLHVLELFTDTEISDTSVASATLGLLMPAHFDMCFPIYPPGEKVMCRLRRIGEGPAQLTLSELEQAAKWSLAAMSLLNVPLASIAGRLKLQVPTLSISHASGEYFVRPPDNIESDGLDKPHCVAVPMSQGDHIDWSFITHTLEPLCNGNFPLLADGLSEDGTCWTAKDGAVRIALRDLVVSGRSCDSSQSKRDRCRFFTELEPAGELQVFNAVVLHRGVLQAGADIFPRPAIKEEHGVVRSGDCRVAPITAKLAAALMALPSAIWLAELRSGATELLHEMGALQPPLRIDSDLLRIALTRAGVATGCNEDFQESHHPAYGEDGERLEFLGDTLLKLVSRAFTFLEEPDAGEGKLTALANRYVTNSFLRDSAERLGLTRRIVAERFQRGKCLAEMRQQEVPWKAPADVLEAFIAVVYLSTSSDAHPGCCLRFNAVLQFFHDHIREGAAFTNSAGSCSASETWFPLIELMERQSTSTARIPLQLRTERLEFLGDAVLQALVVEYLFFEFPDLDPGGLTQMCQWLLGNTYLARRSAARFCQDSNGSWKSILSSVSGGNKSKVPKFLEQQCRTDDSLADFQSAVTSKEDTPKCLADIYEVQVGKCFLKNKGSLAAVWAAFGEDFKLPRAKLLEHLIRHRAQDSADPSMAVSPKTAPEDCDKKAIEQIFQDQGEAAPPKEENGALCNTLATANGHNGANQQLNAKCELNQLVMATVSRQLSKEDVLYQHLPGCQSGFQAVVHLKALEDKPPFAEAVLNFTGEACRSKKEAEQSAAHRALQGLKQCDMSLEQI